MWNRIRQNDVESGEAIGGDEEQGVAEVEDFTNFSGAEFRYARQVK
jgi:hypothetical protein